MTQRLKIIRDKTIGNYAWDRSESYTNNWTNSKLMEMLNGIYYNSQNGDCWTGKSGYASSQSTCQFDGKDGGNRGLSTSARAMIDTDITWNIGGWEDSEVKTPAMYGYERGTKTGNSDAYPAEWNSTNTMAGATFNSVGLMYPSDYGYASAGSNDGSTTRSDCINDTELYSYDTSRCDEKDWLLTEESYELSLSPYLSYSGYEFGLDFDGSVSRSIVSYSYAVRPVVYLTSKVKVNGGTGDSEIPLGSKENPFILTMN